VYYGLTGCPLSRGNIRLWGQHGDWEPHLAHLSLAVKWGVSSISALAWILEGVRFRFAANNFGRIFPGENLEEQRIFARAWINRNKSFYDPQKREELIYQLIDVAKQQRVETDNDFAGVLLDAVFGTELRS
jgi:hypothetical protein